jgi:uncharacterized membrane protein YGL010W
MALMSTRGWDDWISEYGKSHQHPANRVCHTIGIPMIALSILVLVAALLLLSLFCAGTARATRAAPVAVAAE